MPQEHMEVPLGKEVPAEGKTLRWSFEEKENFKGDHSAAVTTYGDGEVREWILGEGGRHWLCCPLGSGQLLECLAAGLAGCALHLCA